MAIRGTVRSCVVNVRTTPLLCAWRQPLVVMPRRLINDLSPQQLRGIVAHELAHLVRRDHWANLFVFVVKALVWWNPVAWWADRELRAAQELCCDAIAIDRSSTDRRSYAITLLTILDFIQAEPSAPYVLAVGMGSKDMILRRFQMIGEKRLSYKLPRGTFLVLLALAVPLVSIPVRGQHPAAVPATPAAADTGAKATAPDASDKKAGTAKQEPVKAGPVAGAQTVDAKIKEVVEAVRKRVRVAMTQTETVVGARPRGNCSISGKVVSAATGEPIVGARLYLHYNVTHGSIFINTVSDGTFLFQDIPTGPFSLQVSHTAGYQDASYDPEGKPGPFPPFSLQDREHRSGIVLKAKQAWRISGKVLDEKGEVPADVRTLTVLAWQTKEDGKKYANATRIGQFGGRFVHDRRALRQARLCYGNQLARGKTRACLPGHLLPRHLFPQRCEADYL